MSLVNPMAMLLAGLAVPIVVFYILKVRLRRVPISTLTDLRRTAKPSRRSVVRRMRSGSSAARSRPKSISPTILPPNRDRSL